MKPPVFQSTTVDLSLPTTVSSTLIDDVNRCIRSLQELSIPFPWGDTVRFKASYLESNVWTKYFDDSKTEAPKVRQSKAIEKWLAVEERNAGTNLRLLMDCDFGRFSSADIRERARAVIHEVIGDTYPDELFLLGEFTNGASTRLRRGHGVSARKYVGSTHATEEAWAVFKEKVAPLVPLWVQYCADENPTIVPGSVMFTVPKNVEIDRVACKEPEINMYMQRACGLYMRSCLRKVGINLQDQTQNQRLAQVGSRSGKLATIDLSSASDSISIQLIAELLPVDWFSLLNSIRCKAVNIGGEMHDMNMFSSMGNGFTFELETLVFYALAKATCYLNGTKGRVCVYGDDIVIPSAAAGLFSKVLSWFGFKLNSKKSFWKGGFRESCGKHYYFGADVSPFFVREPVTTIPRLILFLNQWRTWWTEPQAGLDLASGAGFGLWKKYSELIPPFLWGGKDPAALSSLVSCHSPRRMLNTKSKEGFVNQVGGYLRWHNLAEGVADCVTSRESCTGGFVISRNRTWERTLPLEQKWLEEVFDTPLRL